MKCGWLPVAYIVLIKKSSFLTHYNPFIKGKITFFESDKLIEFHGRHKLYWFWFRIKPATQICYLMSPLLVVHGNTVDSNVLSMSSRIEVRNRKEIDPRYYPSEFYLKNWKVYDTNNTLPCSSLSSKPNVRVRRTVIRKATRRQIATLKNLQGCMAEDGENNLTRFTQSWSVWKMPLPKKCPAESHLHFPIPPKTF